MTSNNILFYTFLKKINIMILSLIIFISIQSVVVFFSVEKMLTGSILKTESNVLNILNLNAVVSVVVLTISFFLMACLYIKEKIRNNKQNKKLDNMIQKLDIVSMIRESGKYEYKREKVKL